MGRPATRATALWVIRRLRAAGHEALLAGGCVRDMLMGRRSSDYDVATSATPEQVRRVFRRVVLIGAKFGVVMVIHRGRMVEVTTFRSDLSYSDGRRPDGVRFATPREDALRRDVTINGMFYDPVAEEVIDYVGGRKDLARGLVRTIGRADERFSEDYLRMVRAVRFAVRFGFRIAPATRSAVARHAPKIASISGERIYDELVKMLSTDSAARALRLLEKVGLAQIVLPELFAGEALWPAAVRRVEAVARRRDVVLALGALLGELPVRTIRKIVRRWGASNELRDSLCLLSRRFGDWRGAAEMSLADFKRMLANDDFPRLRRLWSVQERLETGGQAAGRRIARRVAGIRPSQIAPRPFVTGDDLGKMGMCEGPALGNLLRTVYDAQLNEEVRTRRGAMALARRLVRESAP